MEERSTPWSEVTSGIFGILTAIATYLGTQPLSTLFAVLLGAAVTYSVQKRLQRDSEKRSRNVEYVEKYYGPLLVEIQKIQATVLNDVSGHYDFTSLKDLQTRPQFYTMGKKLRADFLFFIDEIARLAGKMNFYRRKIGGLIRQMGTPYIVNPPGKLCEFVPDLNYAPIYLRYAHESEWFAGTLEDCILRDKSPADIVKDKVTGFQKESLEVEFYLLAKDEQGGSGAEYDRKSYPEREEVLNDIVSKVNTELSKDDGYRIFKSELSDLRRKAASLSARLAKYVEKYVSIVDI